MIKGAVLGSPISHSLSPVLHKAAFDRIGVSGSYEAIDVPSGTLKEFFASNQSFFDYFSLTMPLKRRRTYFQLSAMNCLNELAPLIRCTREVGVGLVLRLMVQVLWPRWPRMDMKIFLVHSSWELAELREQ